MVTQTECNGPFAYEEGAVDHLTWLTFKACTKFGDPLRPIVHLHGAPCSPASGELEPHRSAGLRDATSGPARRGGEGLAAPITQSRAAQALASRQSVRVF